MRGNLGIGFAVPANLVEQNLTALAEGGFTDLSSRPRLGVSIRSVEAYPEAVRESLNLPEAGVAVGDVAAGSAADEAGIRGSEMEIDFRGSPFRHRATLSWLPTVPRSPSPHSS